MYSEKKPYVTYGGAAIGFAYTSGRLAGGYAVDYAADVQYPAEALPRELRRAAQRHHQPNLPARGRPSSWRPGGFLGGTACPEKKQEFFSALTNCHRCGAGAPPQSRKEGEKPWITGRNISAGWRV